MIMGKQTPCRDPQKAVQGIGGNETKPVADLLNSLKVIDPSQRYMECRADLLTQYMYELVKLRAES